MVTNTTDLPDNLDDLKALRNSTMSAYITAREAEQERNDEEDYTPGDSARLMATLRVIDAKIHTMPKPAPIEEPIIDPNNEMTWPSMQSGLVTVEMAYLMGRHAAVTPGCIHPDQGEKHGFFGPVTSAYRRGWEDATKTNGQGE
ncbi:hypothetical protein DFW101_3535 [Solidesulfovibrio carbinoliphilus subsp. oakridgensis]|uniref:Uncharacterized protein n=1 Tax=Solidesulfovibrio carbinoliphilus subsp. oakridgensis TaxID=694327 RepID=G7QC85_9BACT|nr:hypothetical protein [Solidesulfovibrio carbinoliphilus]EHJ49531.1 hypothetical protein DFW101_3535 [Solidesulfovibrio carbinoliphilus subsp. oakridgensis]